MTAKLDSKNCLSSPVEPAPSPQVTPVNTFLSNSLVTDLEGLSLSDTVLSPAVSIVNMPYFPVLRFFTLQPQPLSQQPFWLEIVGLTRVFSIILTPDSEGTLGQLSPGQREAQVSSNLEIICLNGRSKDIFIKMLNKM